MTRLSLIVVFCFGLTALIGCNTNQKPSDNFVNSIWTATLTIHETPKQYLSKDTLKFINDTIIHWFSEFIAGAIIGSAIGIVVGRSFKKSY